MTYMPLRVRAKLFLKKKLPQKLFLVVLNIWRRTGNKFVKYPSFPDIYQEQFIKKYGMTVMGGPFAGMKYIDQSTGSSYITKLIGSYEEILHTTTEDLKRRDYKTIIDIGCAEGYYLNGLGIYNKNATLIGYDIENVALSLTKKLYDANNLTNPLVLEKDCTPEKLDGRITDNTLVICDSEGFEYYILNPEKSKKLEIVQTFVIELHDYAFPDMNIKQTLIDRFSKTHDISVIKWKHANVEKYPFLREMENKLHRYNILYERADQEMEWLVMERK